MDHMPPGSSVHVFSRGDIKVVSISSSKASSQPRDPTHVSSIGRRILYHSATRQALTSIGGFQVSLAFQKLFSHNLSEALEQVALMSRFIHSSLVTQMVKNSPAMQENWV